MIMTVVTEKGKLQAAAAGDVRPPETSGKPVDLGYFRGGLMAGPGQEIHVVDVPDKFADLFATPQELTAQLTVVLAQRGLI